MPVTHTLPLQRRTLHGHFSPDLPPAITVDPGDSVEFQALNAGWRWQADQDWPGARDPLLDDGHALSGPIEVRGARAGQVLAVHIDQVAPADWGVTFADDLPLVWRLQEGRATTADAPATSVALAPFLGVIGMPPAEPGRHSTVPPRWHGGNLDCKELVAGSTLYLPVPVDGALLSVGDGHAAQGDGEVGGTAIECGMTTELTVGLHDAGPLHSVHAVTPSSRITFGFSPDLNAATGDALAAMLTWMQQLLDIDRHTALALAGVVVDLRITQVANQTWGVHAVLPARIVDGH
jgi:acetamidase/formamidase